MYLARELAYNKKETIQFLYVECPPEWVWHSNIVECLFFYAKTNKVDSNRMIHMNFKNFKMKVLVFINICLLSNWRMTLNN